jgi:hypothetical protein
MVIGVLFSPQRHGEHRGTQRKRRRGKETKRQRDKETERLRDTQNFIYEPYN